MLLSSVDCIHRPLIIPTTSTSTTTTNSSSSSHLKTHLPNRPSSHESFKLISIINPSTQRLMRLRSYRPNSNSNSNSNSAAKESHVSSTSAAAASTISISLQTSWSAFPPPPTHHQSFIINRSMKICRVAAQAEAPLSQEEEEEEAPEAAAAPENPAPIPYQSKQKLQVVVNPLQKPRLVLKFIWLEKNIGLALDQVIPGRGAVPLSPYYFWPRKDAWEELKAKLESKPWISQKRMIILLNQATDIINLWQQSGGGNL